jgi:hypothetical protein
VSQFYQKYDVNFKRVRATWTLFTIFILSIFFGCDSKKAEILRGFNNSIEKEIEIDTIKISPSQSSQMGFFQMNEEAVFFVDQAYAIIEEFNLKGESQGIKKRELDGPEELQGISELIPTMEGFIIRHNYVFYRYDINWGFVGKSVLQFSSDVSYDELMDNPKGENIGMYEPQNYNSKTSELPDGNLVTKIDVEHPIFNAFISREYYRNGKILGKINPFTGQVVEILGTRPASFEAFRFVPFHNKMDYYWTKDDLIFVTHEIDSLIYIYDTDWNLKETFGTAGIGMNTTYAESQSLDVAFESKYFYDSRKNEGFYKDIFVDEKNGLVFRTYRQGSNRQDLLDETDNPLRIQIFKEGKLIGDFATPGRFRILGKIGEKYVADGYFDEQNEKQGFYLLNIN